MKLELKKRWIEYKIVTRESEISIGDELEYYHNNTEYYLNNPSLGVIKEDHLGFYIEWEDTEYLTRIDGSVGSQKVLKNCGWK